MQSSQKVACSSLCWSITGLRKVRGWFTYMQTMRRATPIWGAAMARPHPCRADVEQLQRGGVDPLRGVRTAISPAPRNGRGEFELAVERRLRDDFKHRQVAVIVAIREAPYPRRPARRSERHLTVIENRPTAEEDVTSIRQRVTGYPAPIGVQMYRVSADPPTPWLQIAQ